MNTSKWLVRVLVLTAMLVALLLSPGLAAAQGGIVDGSVTASDYGTFNGVAYTRYEGQFVGTTAGDFSVPFEIVAPADAAQGNDVLILEPYHVMGRPLDMYMTPEFVFERGFSYAAVGWYRDTVNPLEGYPVEEAVEILHNFAKALREDPVARDMAGNVTKLYAHGVSLATWPLLDLLQSPGASLLDFSFLTVPAFAEETLVLDSSANRIMVFLTESDLIRGPMQSQHILALRGSSPTYRSYEVAGAAHASDTPWGRTTAMEMFGLDAAAPDALEWTPVMKALFLAGHSWTMEGVEPPPSTYIADAPAGEIDLVYKAEYGLELVTGIARDEDANALGGIRLPNLELGRGQYIAVDPASYLGLGLLSSFRDLQCEPLPDGSARFADHATYVSRFTTQAQALVDQGFLLSEDANDMIAAASASNIGDPAACAPAALPETGQPARGGLPIWLLALTGLVLIVAGLSLRQRVGASRQ